MSQEFDVKLLGGSIKRNLINPDIAEERAKCNFDKKEFAEFIYTKEIIQEIDVIHAEVKKDKNLQTGLDYLELTREQQMAIWWRIISAAYHNPVLREHFFAKNHERMRLGICWTYLFQGSSVLHLHQSMFSKSINFLCSQEQKDRWIPLINNLNILGCYAQTEMGHGSNVAGLETTATFDKATDEFVIHTPSIRATKFWPGGMGIFATHGVVMAVLKIDGKQYGVQAFMVPIRDRATHKPFPGIEVGELGTKLGLNSTDNGYLSFNQYRVPRISLLNRFVNVSREGEFELLGDPRLLYQIMVITRMMIIFASGFALFKACATATRYAVCRRQFVAAKGDKQERKIIDYQTHMHILGPNLANAFIISLSSRAVEALLNQSVKFCEQGDFKLLDICHHMTSGMKSICTELQYKGTDECRQSCGGAGYHIASGLVMTFCDYAVMATFEGVNVILYQQSARYAIKQVKKAKQGKKCTGPFTYINHLSELLKSKSTAKSVEEACTLDFVDSLLKVRSAFHLEQTCTDLVNSKASETVKMNELFSMDIQKMAKYHMIYIMFLLSRQAINEYKYKDQNVKANLELILKIFALKQIQEDTHGLYECGFFTNGSGKLVDEALKALLNQLRPQMIPLVEIIETETFVGSAVGNYHGDIYESLLDFSKTSKLNKPELPAYYEQYMKPLIQGNGDGGKFKL